MIWLDIGGTNDIKLDRECRRISGQSIMSIPTLFERLMGVPSRERGESVDSSESSGSMTTSSSRQSFHICVSIALMSVSTVASWTKRISSAATLSGDAASTCWLVGVPARANDGEDVIYLFVSYDIDYMCSELTLRTLSVAVPPGIRGVVSNTGMVASNQDLYRLTIYRCLLVSESITRNACILVGSVSKTYGSTQARRPVRSISSRLQSTLRQLAR